MRNFCQPNLPYDNVNTVIASGEYSYITAELKKLGINTVCTQPYNRLPFFERYHADMQISYYDYGRAIIGYERENLKKALTDLGIKVNASKSDIQSKYPHNIALNHIILGKNIICNTKHTDNKILDYCRKNNFNIINTKQGYAKCSTAVITENAVITADNDIYKRCLANNIDVLKIGYGDISLYGYDYGFIGGCCGKLSKDIIAFTGKLSDHKSYDNIKAFLRSYNVYPIELSNKPLNDIGGITPIF